MSCILINKLTAIILSLCNSWLSAWPKGEIYPILHFEAIYPREYAHIGLLGLKQLKRDSFYLAFKVRKCDVPIRANQASTLT